MSQDINRVLDNLLEYSKSIATSFKSYDRELKFWSEVNTFPALFLRHTGQIDEYDGEGLQKTTVKAELWYYGQTGGSEAPDTEGTRLDAEVRSIFAPDDDSRNVFTIGGLVYSCRIEGETDLDTGDSDGFIKGIVPVRILLP